MNHLLKHFMIVVSFLLLLINSFIYSIDVYAAAPPAAPGDGVDIGQKFIPGGEDSIVGISNATKYGHLNSVGGLISTILPNVFVIAGLIIFFFILLGGFTMITSAGNPEKQKEGSQMLTGAVLGFAVIFGAYWIVQLIGMILGIDILNPTGSV